MLASAKDSIFVAGADLHSIADASLTELASIVELGQAVFNRLSSLDDSDRRRDPRRVRGGRLRNVSGVRLSTGHAGSLDKDRIAGDAIGNSARVGWFDATAPADRGAQSPGRDPGREDSVCPAGVETRHGGRPGAAREHRRSALAGESLWENVVLPGRVARFRLRVINSALVARAISRRVAAQLQKRTRGHYPALFKALEVVTQGVSRSQPESLALEREAILELARTSECRHLIRVFFLQEQAKKRVFDSGLAKADGRRIHRTAVIGAGVMGAGIAQWISSRGMPVLLRDVGVEQVAKGMTNIAGLYEEGVKRHAFTRVEARAGLDRIFPSATEVPLKNFDLVIEAAVEKMPLKKAIFNGLSRLAGPDTILATNTSALSVSEIATSVQAPERVLGLHFFNPVHRMQLVEVVAGDRTSAEVVQRALRFVQQIGKLPVVVRDSPGFLVNRILMPYLIEAGRLFESGASVKAIDEAMLDFGMPMGPLRLIDEVGADVAAHVVETLSASFGERMAAPRVLGEMCLAGMLGRKSGRGFYVHEHRTPEANASLNVFRRDDRARDFDRESLQRRMVLLMVNEAARCLEEGVVTNPADVDFAMIMGTGFAPFRGGPLGHADALGVGEVVDELKRLVQSDGPRFEPCELLKNMAATSRRFHPEKGAQP